MRTRGPEDSCLGEHLEWALNGHGQASWHLSLPKASPYIPTWLVEHFQFTHIWVKALGLSHPLINTAHQF